jgi:hypothetical protein
MVKRMLTGVALVVLSASLLNCGSSVFDQLPPADQDLWRRCFEAMRPAMCGGSTDSLAVGICGRRNGDTYAELPSSAARREWAVSHGCPPSMVNPSAYTSGGSR